MNSEIYIALYIVLAILVICYLYVLFANNKKILFIRGRKKKVLKILNDHVDIKPRYTKKIMKIIEDLGPLFCKNGEIDFEVMLDTLAAIRSEENSNDSKIIPTIDIICDAIKENYPFLHVSNESAALFKQVNDDIYNGHTQKATDNLNLLYNKCIEIEKSVRQHHRLDFWIGTAIGIIGIVISIASWLI